MSRLPEADYAYRRLEQIPLGGILTQEEMEILLGCPLPGYALLFGGEIRFALRPPPMEVWIDAASKQPATFDVKDILCLPPLPPEARFRVERWEPAFRLRQAMTHRHPLLLQYCRTK